MSACLSDGNKNLYYVQHGRLKVRSTAEQQEAKRKEKEKKLQIYRSTVANIFEKVSLYFVKMLKVCCLSVIVTFCITHSQAKCIVAMAICLFVCVCLVLHSYTTACTRL